MDQRVEEGAIVVYENRHWIVGLVNNCRARLDPLSPAKLTTLGDHIVGSYGDSVNIGPTSILPTVEPDELPDKEFNRYLRMLGKSDEPAEVRPHVASMMEFTSDEEEENMAAVAAQPMKGKAKAKAKVRDLKPRTIKEKEKRAPRDCSCGCGEKTGGGYFIPGHDSKFKSALLKIERGEVELEKGLPKKVRDQYKWRKKGSGWIPTTNYKGETHNGYVEE